MTRVNVAINPIYLADQHLIAESVEITMIPGSLKKNKFVIKSKIPDLYTLGTGHMNFFKYKMVYLAKRLMAVNIEMRRRGFNPGTNVESIQGIPIEFQNDWFPTIEDSKIVRDRIVQKLLSKPDGFWRYQRKVISNIYDFKDFIIGGERFYV